MTRDQAGRSSALRHTSSAAILSTLTCAGHEAMEQLYEKPYVQVFKARMILSGGTSRWFAKQNEILLRYAGALETISEPRFFEGERRYQDELLAELKISSWMVMIIHKSPCDAKPTVL